MRVPYTSQKMTLASLMRRISLAEKRICVVPSFPRKFTIAEGWCEELYDVMSDFHQSGVITTFHRLGKYNLEAIEATLAEYTEQRPVALVLPSLYSELQGPALKNILQHLREVRYIRQVVIGLDRADRSEFEHARKFFSVLPQEVKILWRDGPRLRKLTKLMVKNDVSTGGPGKGSNM